MGISEEQQTELQKILDGRQVTAVFQPIVHLPGQRIYGYEALSRGPAHSPLQAPAELFRVARQTGDLGRLEQLCLETACQTFAGLQLPGQLFLNISPPTLLDNPDWLPHLLALLERLDLPPQRITLEITEQFPVLQPEQLRSRLEHCKAQGLHIALDDLGSGYATLRLWSELRPDHVKIDRYFIAGIQQDPFRRGLVEAFISIARTSGTLLIAEGIENPGELQVLQACGISLVQGYLLGRPDRQPARNICELSGLSALPARQPPDAGHGNLDRLVCREPAIPESSPIARVMECFRQPDSPDSLAVINSRQQPVGIVHRHLFTQELLRPFATDLLARKPISRLMKPQFLMVEHSDSLQQISRLLTSQPGHRMDEDFIIADGGRYLGMGRSIDVLRQITEITILQARQANPLTLLPGNLAIQRYLGQLQLQRQGALICYIDIDNFKPFNDLYGYAQGDRVLVTLANGLTEMACPDREFVGHIGGDDFILVLAPDLPGGLARIQQLSASFQQRCRPLYNPEHLQSGSFTAPDRQGQLQRFPLLSLSVGIVALAKDSPDQPDADTLASLASQAKKQAKQLKPGNSIYLIQPPERRPAECQSLVPVA